MSETNPSCPRCKGQMKAVRARDIWLRSQELNEPASSLLYTAYMSMGHDVGFQCLTCPNTFVGMYSRQPYCLVFPHKFGQYGGYFQMWRNSAYLYFVDEKGKKYVRVEPLFFPIPWDISEERLKTILTFM
jgi:hypothetical protein